MSIRQAAQRQDAVLPAIRMYKSELDTIKHAASAANQSLSDYVRSRLLADVPPLISQNTNLLDSPLPSPPPFPSVLTRSNQNLESTPNETKGNSARDFDWIDKEVCRKFGHRLGCDCMECERFRRMLRSTGKQSAKDPREKVTSNKHTRGKR